MNREILEIKQPVTSKKIKETLYIPKYNWEKRNEVVTHLRTMNNPKEWLEKNQEKIFKEGDEKYSIQFLSDRGWVGLGGFFNYDGNIDDFLYDDDMYYNDRVKQGFNDMNIYAMKVLEMKK